MKTKKRIVVKKNITTPVIEKRVYLNQFISLLNSYEVCTNLVKGVISLADSNPSLQLHYLKLVHVNRHADFSDLEFDRHLEQLLHDLSKFYTMDECFEIFNSVYQKREPNFTTFHNDDDHFMLESFGGVHEKNVGPKLKYSRCRRLKMDGHSCLLRYSHLEYRPNMNSIAVAYLEAKFPEDGSDQNLTLIRYDAIQLPNRKPFHEESKALQFFNKLKPRMEFVLEPKDSDFNPDISAEAKILSRDLKNYLARVDNN